MEKSELERAYVVLDDFICMALNRVPQKILNEIFEDIVMSGDIEKCDNAFEYSCKIIDAIETVKNLIEKETGNGIQL